MAKHRASLAERWASRTATQRSKTLARIASGNDPHLEDFGRGGAYQFVANEQAVRATEPEAARHRSEKPTRKRGSESIHAALGHDVQPF